MDKTGTVTEGHPRVVVIHTLISENRLSLIKLFAIIGSAESNSEHPIANSITSFVKEVSQFLDISGNSILRGDLQIHTVLFIVFI